MTSPEQGTHITITEADLAETQDVAVTHELPKVDVNRQLPPITRDHVRQGAEDVLTGRLSRDASPELVASEQAYARTVLGHDN
ncbi:MAG TPA: hypothetical protein PKB09_00530 [Candidatus Saccharibacteria bacterium]|nr:hypothetical protein [Candidatus Saccharibacteria bacterium]